jgi:hypothetical protein
MFNTFARQVPQKASHFSCSPTPTQPKSCYAQNRSFHTGKTLKDASHRFLRDLRPEPADIFFHAAIHV